MTDPRYHYRCRLLQAIDGDTVDLEIDLGFHARLAVRARLAGVNAPERKAASAYERDLALAATMHVAEWCGPRADRLICKTERDGRDKFGRMLATLIDQETGATVQQSLIAAGLAVPYDGQGARQPWRAGQ